LASSASFSVAVCILLKNSLKNIEAGLPLVLSQRTEHLFEIIVVDSGSTDGSLQFVRKMADSANTLRVVTIDPAQFHHARTRNYAASLSNARYLVFLNGDAVPAGDRWLEQLTAPLMDEASGVALSYSRQVCRPDVDSNNACRIAFNYGDKSLIRGMDVPSGAKERYFFSSVSCCVDTQQLSPPLFPEDLPVNEDMALAERALHSGHRIAYCAESVVCHSHNHGYGGILRRSFDNAVVYHRMGYFKESGPGFKRDGLDYLTTSMRCLRGQGPVRKAQFLLFFVCTALGAVLGKHYALLPHSLAQRLTVYGTV